MTTETQHELLDSLADAVEHMYESRHVLGYPEGPRWVRKSEVLALIRAWRERPSLVPVSEPVDGTTAHYPSGIGVSNANAGQRHCTGCGEPWPCTTQRQGEALYEAVKPHLRPVSEPFDGLREAADYAGRVLDLWLTGDEDFTEATVRGAIAKVRAALAARQSGDPR